MFTGGNQNLTAYITTTIPGQFNVKKFGSSTFLFCSYRWQRNFIKILTKFSSLAAALLATPLY